jgi:hypothetical protein
VKTEYWLFAGGVLWAMPLGVVYGMLSGWEAVGTTGIFLVGGLGALVGSYLWVTSRRIDPRPEDDAFAEIADGAGEQGVFAPHSWWPLALSISAAIVFVGVPVGWWLMLLGGGFAILALIGWVFEFYRGAHAH